MKQGTSAKSSLHKPKVSYSLPFKRTLDCSTTVQIKVIISYNRKRLSFPINCPDYAVVWQFAVFNPDGSIKPEGVDYIPPKNRKKVLLYSRMLLNLRKALSKIVESVVERDLWDKMTSETIRSFARAFDWNNNAEITNLNMVIGDNGLVDIWARQER